MSQVSSYSRNRDTIRDLQSRVRMPEAVDMDLR